ncbi:MAG: hypothetical protein CTY29_08810 [Methylobacter sp.]|nr:MAG: hypothetical protein CTY29_08810 [Methylobacter sp.]
MFYKAEFRALNGKRLSLWAISLSIAVLVLISLDMVADYQEGVSWRHWFFEGALLLLALTVLIYFGRYYFSLTKATIGQTEQDAASARQQARQWRETNQEVVAVLARQIQQQFEIWQLTQAEVEVGMLLLKGLSLAEIAGLRSASERTIRDQARSIYHKSGVTGRAELSAFFLEGLLPGE